MSYARFNCAFSGHPFCEKMHAVDQIGLSAFGDILKAFRKRKGMSQLELAARLGVHRNTIGTWERGDYLPDSKSMVLELANHLRLNDYETRQLLEASLTALSSHWFVPYQRNPFFTGRDEILLLLHEKLWPEKTPTHARSYALCGLGGVGKTQIAIEYAYRHSQEYAAIFWIGADTQDSIVSSFVSIAKLLDLHVKYEQDQSQAVASVMRWLDAHTNWLLIVDNVEDIGMVKHILPAARQGSILLTTRLQALKGIARRIETQPMTLDEGARLLLQRISLEHASQADYTAAITIAEAMDGLPLALDQAGAYIEETQCSLPDFLQLFEEQPVSLLQERDAHADHPLSVAKTFLLSFEKIQQANPVAADLLTVCSFLAPDAIPEELLTRSASGLGPHLQSIASDPFQFNAALKELQAYSLIHRNAETKMLFMHRLVQTALKQSMPEALRREWVGRVTRILHQHFPADITRNDYWQRCEQLLPHTLTCLAQVAQWQITSLDISSLLAKTSAYLSHKGRYDEAEPLLVSAIQINEAALGPGHPGMATLLNDLALLYTRQGRHAQAERLFQQAMQTYEQAGSPDQLNLAYCLSSLAILYRDQFRYEEAEALIQRALFTREQALGPGDPWVAMSLYDLALLYTRQGRYAPAERLLQRAVQVWEQAGRSDHPYLLFCLNELAQLYYMQGKYEEAGSLFRRVLPGYEQARRFSQPYQAY